MLHELHVRGPEAPEAQVDEPAGARRDVRREVDGRVGRPHAGVQSVPGRVERALPRVVGLRRVQVEVQVGRRGDELEVRQGPAAALRVPRGEVGPHVAVRPVVLLAEGLPGGPVVGRVAGEDRRDGRVGDLGGVAADDADPGAARRRERREPDDVVLHDDVRPDLVEDLPEPVVHVPRPVDERLPRRLDEAAELVDRRRPEDRRGVADEVLPELAGGLLDLRPGPEAHEALLEALRLEVPRERLLDDEDDARAPRPEHLADPHAVVRGAVRALGEEDDRRTGSAHGTSLSLRGRTRAPLSAPRGSPDDHPNEWVGGARPPGRSARPASRATGVPCRCP